MAIEPSPTVTCVGIAVHDIVFSLNETLVGGAKNLATSMRTVGGGPAANAAVSIAALGGDARLIANLGDDTIGDSIIAELQGHSVDVSRIRRVPNVASPVSSVAIDTAGERTIINYTDSRLVDRSRPVSTGDLAGSDAVLVDLRWPDGARSAIAGATALGLPTIVDFDLTTAESAGDIVESASHVVFSRSALLKHAGTQNIDVALRAISASTSAFVAVTLGAEGVRWLENGSVRSLSAFTVPVIDTLGAGDVFHGVFAFGLAMHRSVAESLQLAAAASAIKCSRPGGRAGVPNRADLERFLASKSC